MKRWICLLLCVALLLSQVACGRNATVSPATLPRAEPVGKPTSVEELLIMVEALAAQGQVEAALNMLDQSDFVDPRVDAALAVLAQVDAATPGMMEQSTSAVIIPSAVEQQIRTMNEELAQEAAIALPMPALTGQELCLDTSRVQPLDITRERIFPVSQGNVNPYDNFVAKTFPSNDSLQDNLPLACSLFFSDTTQFSDDMPSGFDSKALLEWGKEPGLGVDVLHQLGYTGKGAVIAYIDQPIDPDHEAYINVDLYTTCSTEESGSMHGPAVLSLLAGQECGTAPDATVYFYGISSREQNALADSLYKVIAQNKNLPEDQRITMVALSDNIDPTEAYADDLRQAINACEEASIMVWLCGEYRPAAFLPMSDKNNFENVIPDSWIVSSDGDQVFVPSGSRTTATAEGGTYIYWPSGGLSWTMPYVLGLYAIVTEIAPNLTQDELRQMLVATAYHNGGMQIINPVELVAVALESVGRANDAADLRDAWVNSRRYFYAVIDKSALTKEDLKAIEYYLAQITDATVLVVDAEGIASAQELYALLQADHIQRGGQVIGLQLFGDASLIPSFEIAWKVQSRGYTDKKETFLTDLFYGNFSNRADDLNTKYSVMDQFAEGWPIQLSPQWPVARLPLKSGEFAPFMEKYMAFGTETGFRNLDIVSFSCPIFPSDVHIDDMGTLLSRMSEEYCVLESPYRLYGVLDSVCPVTNEVLGDVTKENLSFENTQGSCEFIINSHGQQNNIDKTFFRGSQRGYQSLTESLVNSDDINSVLSANPYYLDAWTCYNGQYMQDNLTTTALKGQCVGMFSSTHVLSNNGIDVNADLGLWTNGNPFWFYLNYLMALDTGSSRSQAFFQAQRSYANALLVCSTKGSDYFANYQYNLHNLLAYHNFGLIEPTKAYACMDSQAALPE